MPARSEYKLMFLSLADKYKHIQSLISEIAKMKKVVPVRVSRKMRVVSVRSQISPKMMSPIVYLYTIRDLERLKG